MGDIVTTAGSKIVTRVVLLACGSFNPITNMHLRLFELARDFLHSTGRYRVIGGIISPVCDRYNRKILASAEHRRSMIKLALQSSNWIRLDTWESEQKEWTETVKVLRHHAEHTVPTFTGNTALNKKRKLGLKKDDIPTDGAEQTVSVIDSTNTSSSSEPVEVKLLCGSDFLETFAIPGLWKDEDVCEVVQRFGMVVITRAGSDPHQFIYNSDILTHHRGNIMVVREWIMNEISATKIRMAVRRGQSIKYLVHDTVVDYINKHSLYTSTQSNNLTPLGNNNNNDLPPLDVDK